MKLTQIEGDETDGLPIVVGVRISLVRLMSWRGVNMEDKVYACVKVESINRADRQDKVSYTYHIECNPV